MLQKYADFEIIVVDDGSSSELSAFISFYIPRLKLIRHDKNLGVSAARNSGILASKGEYVAFLDSDDIFLPDKLSSQLRYMIDGDYKISHTDEFWYKKDKWLNQGPKQKRFGGEIFCNVLDKCRVSPSSLMIRRDLFDKIGFFDESLPVCEDYEFTLRAALSYPFGYINERLLIKRSITNDQLSFSIKHIESIRLDILRDFASKNILEGAEKEAVEKELLRKSAIVKNN